MKVLICALVLVLIVPISAVDYQSNELRFTIPANWSVIKENSTQIVLSDNVSAIRIDIIKNAGLLKIIKNYLNETLPQSENHYAGIDEKSLSLLFYNIPWQCNDAVINFYRNKIIKSATNLGSSGSGISIMPDGVEYAGVATNSYENSEVSEWILAWTKPEYGDKIIGVHALFKGNYLGKNLEWRGAPHNYTMSEPLWTVLTTINTGTKPKEKSLIDLV